MAEDWREKLGKAFEREVPEEKTEEKDWGKAYNEAEKRQQKRSRSYPGKRPGGGGASTYVRTTQMATAPYNFVSLPDAILPAPLDQELAWHKMEEGERCERYKKYLLQEGGKTGRIELDIEMLTPGFIGGSGTKFFSPAGRPILPGSTLRGLVKNMLRITSCGAMRPGTEFTERHLYFRSLVDKGSDLADYYKARMIETIQVTVTEGEGENAVEKEVDKLVSKARAGFLIRVQGKYFICPAEKQGMLIPPNDPQNEARIDWNRKEQSADIVTGKAPKEKKVYYRVQNADWNKESRIPVPEMVMKSYRDDKSRNRFDLLKPAGPKELARGLTGGEAQKFTNSKDVDFVVPCFYVAQDNAVQHFGHGRYYRIPYESRIGDHVPAGLKKDTIDFADAIFGCKALWAGRVSFEDAELIGAPTPLAPSYSRPLMSPNPTSFQLYLEQKGNDPAHWDKEKGRKLRGYKLYWHQPNSKDAWRLGGSGNVVKGMQEIEPLAAGSRFQGAIRFKNLRPEELGALLEVFSLSTGEEDICFKLGQGKSIGLGSVRIKTRLFLEDTEKQFSSLFEGGKWREDLVEADGKSALEAFRTYRDNWLGKDRNRFDKLMAELRMMLNWKTTTLLNWKEKTSMMRIGDKSDRRFVDRVVLKPALEFVKEKY